MKKIFLTIMILSGLFIQSAFAESIKDYITSNFEYSTSKDSSSNLITTSKGNQYYLLGGYIYNPVTNINSLKYFRKNFENGFFLFDGNKISFVDINSNKVSADGCTAINSSNSDIFYKYIDSQNFSTLKITNYADKVLGQLENLDMQCFYDKTDLYIITSDYADYDLEYLMKNISSVGLKLNGLKTAVKGNSDNMSVLKTIYDYVMSNTSYNFEVLKNFSNPPADGYPFRVAPFFQGKKIVCDGYTRVFNFISAYLGIPTKRVLGSLQPTETSVYNFEGLGHSWVQYGDLYLDPTFDDTDDKNTDSYFGKSQTCFNLNHYTTGWVYFKNVSDRWNFINSNGEHLIQNCSDILGRYIFDSNTLDFAKYSLANYSLESNKKLFCNLFKINDVCGNVSSKNDLISRLKKYSFEIKVDGTKISIDFGKSLNNFKVEESIKSTASIENKQISQNAYSTLDSEKQLIKIQIDKFFEKIKTYPADKKSAILVSLKTRLNKLSQTKNLPEKSSFLLEYFNKLYILEQING